MLKKIALWLIWPVLFGACIAWTSYGYAIGSPTIFFNLAYLSLATILLILEKIIPYEKSWVASDGQIWADLAHNLLSRGTVWILATFTAMAGIAAYITSSTESGYGIWPRDWPLWLQAILGMVIAEFGLYWAHRLAHEWNFLWRFHAIHHSVSKLWVINTGRFHFVDSIKSILISVVILLALGAPVEVVTWVSAITSFVGLMAHCNVEMRCGFISYIFNTPELHRWHHSRNIREGNKNYAAAIMLWDMLFGTWFHQPKRRPPADIGINEYMPPKFIDQLIWPFLSRRARKTWMR